MKIAIYRFLALSTAVLVLFSCIKEKDILDDGGARITLSEVEEVEYDTASLLMSTLCGKTFELEEMEGL